MEIQFVNWAASLIRRHIQEVCFGITAVTLVITGPSINGLFKHITRNVHWFIRYLCFVLLCTAGYGFLTQVVYQGIRNWLRGQSNVLLVVWTCAIYIFLAWMAKRQKEI